MIRLLVADEDPDTRYGVEEFTRGGRFECVLAANFDEAIRFGTRPRTKIDILVASLMIPPYHAGALANRIATDNPGMKVLFMTGLDSGLLASGLLVPGTQLLRKPFAKSRLLEALDIVGRRGRPWAELAMAAESR